MKKQYGITLIELMVVIKLVAILATLALPSMTGMLKNNRLTAQANSLIGTIQYARSEAVNRAENVTVEPLAGAGTDWTQGWKISLANGDVIRNLEAIEGGTLLSVEDTMVFEPSGFAFAANVLTLTADECTGQHIRTITLSLSGSTKIARAYCP